MQVPEAASRVSPCLAVDAGPPQAGRAAAGHVVTGCSPPHLHTWAQPGAKVAVWTGCRRKGEGTLLAGSPCLCSVNPDGILGLGHGRLAVGDPALSGGRQGRGCSAAEPTARPGGPLSCRLCGGWAHATVTDSQCPTHLLPAPAPDGRLESPHAPWWERPPSLCRMPAGFCRGPGGHSAVGGTAHGQAEQAEETFWPHRIPA